MTTQVNWKGFGTLIEREIYRFMRLFKRTVVPPIISTLLYVVIFGFSLGSRIKEIEGFDYIVYILPGLAQMTLINGCFNNASFSLFVSKQERSIENLLTAPLNYFQIVSSYVLGSMVRGFTTATCTLCVAAFFVDLPLPHFGWLITSWLLSAFTFSSLGVILGIFSESWENIGNVQSFVLIPLIYLGGSFYSIRMLPDFWERVSLMNPVFYSVDLSRYGIIGVSDTNPWTSLLFMLCLGGGAFSLSVWLFRKGKNLIS